MEPPAPASSPGIPPPPPPAVDKQGKVVLPTAADAVPRPPDDAAAACNVAAPAATTSLPPMPPDAEKKRRRAVVKKKSGAVPRKKNGAPPAPPPPPPPPEITSPPPPVSNAGQAEAGSGAYEVFQEIPPSAQKDPEVDSFMAMLNDDSIGIDDIAFSMGHDVSEVEEQDVVEMDTPTMKKKNSRLSNYKVEEDEALCYAWMNASLDAAIGTDQIKDTFWRRIEEYYRCNVKIESNRTQGSLSHCWSIIHDCCSRWSGCVDQVDRMPPSGVPLTEQETYIQALYKQRNKKNGHKPFTLLHCWAILKGNEKWAKRNWETTPKRARLSMSSSIDLEEEGEGDDEERGRSPTPSSRPDGRKKEKERKRSGGESGVYKEELKEMIETRKELAAKRKQDKAARWMELKEIEEERLRVKASYEARMVEIEERKACEERRLAIEKERLKLEAEKEMTKKKEQEERIMFMDASGMDEKDHVYLIYVLCSMSLLLDELCSMMMNDALN